MELNDLFNVATLNSRFNDLIVHHYLIGVKRWHEEKFAIFFYDNSIHETSIYQLIDGKWKFITYEYEQTLKVLRHFGHVFRTIKVYFDNFGDAEYREIAQYINEYCTEASIYFSIKNSIQITNWDISFENVHSVDLNDLPSLAQFDLLKFFPNIQQITIENVRDLPLIDQHFPTLTHFTLRTTYDWADEPALSEFIRLNPQLRKFGTTLFEDFSYLEYVHKMLPNLNELSIENNIMYRINSPPKPTLRFANVTKFSFAFGHLFKTGDDILNYVPSIEFDALQSITVNMMEITKGSGQLIDPLIDFIGKYNTAASVECATAEWSYEQTMRFVQLMPNMNHLDFALCQKSEQEVHDFRRFLTDDTQLRTMQISLDGPYYGWKIDEMIEPLQEQWKVTYENRRKSALLERIV